MLLIDCPWCGPRDETEFHYGGQAHVAYPATRPRCPTRMGRSTSSSATTPRAASPSAGCHSRRLPPLVQRRPRHRHLPVPRRLPPRASRSRSTCDEHQRTGSPTGGRIDRAPRCASPFDGDALTGHPATPSPRRCWPTGVHRVAHVASTAAGPAASSPPASRSPTRWCRSSEPLLRADAARATTVELVDGLVARGLPGQGRLDRPPTRPLRQDVHAHTRRAGRRRRPGRAGRRARRRPLRRPRDPGRRADRARRLAAVGHRAVDGAPALDWVAAAVADWPRSRRRVLKRTTAFGCYDDNYVLAVAAAHRPPGPARAEASPGNGLAHPGPPGRARHRRPRAPAGLRRQRPPRRHARRRRPHLPQPLRGAAGPRVVVFTTNDSAYAAAADLRRPGSGSPPSSTPGRQPAHAARAAWTRHRVAPGTPSPARAARPGHRTPCRAVAGRRATATRRTLRPAAGLRRLEPGGAPVQPGRRQARYDDDLGAFVPGRAAAASVAGSPHGAVDLAGVPGRRAPRPATAARRLGFAESTPPPVAIGPPRPAPTAVLWSCPTRDRGPGRPSFVDLQRDATVADSLRATGAGLRSVEHVKRYTTTGTAHDQGKTSGVIASGDHRRRPRRRRRPDSAPPPSGRRTRRSPSPPWPAATAASCSTRSAPPPSTPGTSTHGADVRGRRPVEAPLVLPAGRRGHGRRRAARVRGRPHRRRHHGRLHPRQDRRPGPGRRRASSTGSTPT